jgi:site-specific DNA recombinase
MSLATVTPAAAFEPDGGDEAVLYLRVSTKEQAKRGGEAEGFSIPAQREACTRKADSLSAVVVEEFVDAGESARSADRPDLQRMLAYLAEHPVKYVIVHKIDRLARNRVDDVTINLAIQQAGATLVSCTENIDETPSGALLHGIMSSINEFYSRNLANEVIKGTQQKVKSGGTPTLAPIGYLNVRQIVEGREVRTIELDPERAPLIAWAFEVYATGEWSLNRLAHELEVRGLSQRPTAKRATRPLNAKKLAQVLHNPYYIGTVTWRGLQFDGKHPRLVSLELFAQVQAVLVAHRQSGERSYRRKHYLAGTIYCGRCASKLIYGVSTGRKGEAYAYWFCLGRHTYKNGCELPYLPAEQVEEQVALAWAGEKLSEEQAAIIRDNLLADLADYTTTTEEAAERLDRRAEAIERQRRKWAEKAFEGSVPGDIAHEKQTELTNQLATIHSQRSRLARTSAEHAAVIRDATALLPHCGQAYRRGDDSLRRDYNQAWFEQILVDSEQGQTKVTSVTRTQLFEALHQAEVRAETDNEAGQPGEAEQELDMGVFQQLLASEPDETGQDEKPGRFRARVVHRVGGSKVALLVELRGFEPLTPSMRTRCATGLRHSPGPD